MDIDDPEDAIASLRDRLLIEPRNITAMLDLASCLSRAGDLPGAIDLYQRALRVDPATLPAALGLADLWIALGDGARARSWFERALAIDPDDERAAAGLRSTDTSAPTEAYVRTLFDQYAASFDRDLTGTLKYRAPELVGALLGRVGVVPHAARILDLGCGTGLSGQALAPYARVLGGVDLSPRMIERARARGIYHALTVAEAGRFLAEADETWDIIAAVDMLNYVGELSPILRAAAGRLADGGLLAATIERRVEGGIGLTEKRRYAHGADHLEAAAAAAGLTVLALEEAALRTEGGEPVAGCVFALRRAGG